ncbi:PREDICTED: uncharacterized protein LOC106338429 [Brassica oleracea var. oleracea]|uniref:uncharacterized protein LOC106338429 n=1 Tax=Brassica oleracea var. oleracea TaxID=109376 RepID=UPI0006A7068C|nr:PREDICTED: uncharacterized protein LOC106338429 [Brassica oleracea var. oleracea]
MADFLHKAIGAMSIEDEEPLVLPESPQFTVLDANETSMLGRLLNPDCQSMSRMIDYMPTAWRVYGRVLGIALTRDRFKFVFQREEDLVTVLNDRPWSYNHCAMALERWTASPHEDFLRTMEIWIRIRNIRQIHFTSEMMYKLASEIGKVEVITYDPKVSHTKEYIRAKITFHVDNPAKASRKLSVKSGGTVSIEYDYEKIHKCCFHCLRLTHEKIRCPLLKKGQIKASGGSTSSMIPPIKTPNMHALINPSRGEALAAPPGFPPLFPELSRADQKMAMLYISHSDETERNARILRVRQGIEDNRESSLRLIRITNEIDKGKGHVFHYTEKSIYQEDSSKRFRVGPQLLLGNTEDEAESSANAPDTLSAPAFVSSGFQLRPTSEGRASGNLSLGKAPRNRPPSWKRKANPKKGNSAFGPTLKGQEQLAANGMKRKQSVSASAVDNKSPKYTESSVASVLKPLQPQ